MERKLQEEAQKTGGAKPQMVKNPQLYKYKKKSKDTLNAAGNLPNDNLDIPELDDDLLDLDKKKASPAVQKTQAYIFDEDDSLSDSDEVKKKPKKGKKDDDDSISDHSSDDEENSIDLRKYKYFRESEQREKEDEDGDGSDGKGKNMQRVGYNSFIEVAGSAQSSSQELNKLVSPNGKQRNNSQDEYDDIVLKELDEMDSPVHLNEGTRKKGHHMTPTI